MGDTEHRDYDESDSSPQYHIPACDDQSKPFVGRNFENFEAAVTFYKIYAEGCGFDIRMGSKHKCPRDGSIIRQYVYCNRQGYKNIVPGGVNMSSPKVKRCRISSRVGCMARIVFKFDSGKGCVVERFEEGHTHQLVHGEFQKYMKVNRKLGYVEKNFIMNCARVNIGPTQAYRFYKELIGDNSDIGSTVVDWKNFSRDRKAYVDGCDAHLMLRKMALKKESCSAFFYDYSVDEHDQMTCVFWADPIARQNYSIFGDVVSFDCTYGTNKYNMIFASFTGKDNHDKIVTFGNALLSGKDHKMYTWIFEKFKECMRRSPLLLITDQDHALKIVVEVMFPESTHRLCTWHIMMKVLEKISAHLEKSDDFRMRLDAIVWSNMIVASEFEQQWKDVMVEFGLADDTWFSGLYDIRHFWIPAYFKDLPMSGICRSVSISENVNSFFGHFLSQGSNLVEFLMHFERAVDAQRQTNDRLNYLDTTTIFPLKTPLPIEKHAASIYTKNQFMKMQEEIEASCFSCSVTSMDQHDALNIYEVDDGLSGLVKVTNDKDRDNIDCSCNKFIRDGMLCCHIFLIFKYLKLSVIPEKYIIYRWTKAAYENSMTDIVDVSLDRCVLLDDKRKKTNKIISDFYACVGIVEGDKDKTQILIDGVSALKNALVSRDDEASSSNMNSKLFDIFYGIEKPTEIDVHPPRLVETEECGSQMKTRMEAAMKPKRMCNKCKKLSHHDARNCKS